MTEAVKTCLTEARAKIADSKHWTREAYARDKDGGAVDPRSPNACKFCAIGAIYASCSVVSTQLDAANALDVAAREIGPVYGAVSLNDYGVEDAAHKRVLAAYDVAIAKAVAQ